MNNAPPPISKAAAVAWAGGTQTKLAAKLGTTKQAVCQWPDDEIPLRRQWQMLAMGYRAEVAAAEPAEQ